MRKGVLFCLCVLLAAVTVQADWVVVYQDDFSGAAGNANTTVPEESVSGFSPSAYLTGLSGDGKLYATNNNASAGYRFQIAEEALSADPTITQIKWTAVLKTPTNGWIGIGFQGAGGNAFNTADTDSGPWVQINGTSLVSIRGGHALTGSLTTVGVDDSGFSGGDVIKMEFIYDFATKKADLLVDDLLIAGGVDISHLLQDGVTSADPVFWGALLQLRSQADIDGGGAYIDSFQISVIPEPATLGMVGLGALVVMTVRRRLARG